MAEIEPLAGGRVWSGRDAAERGLVDELGGLERALGVVRKQLGRRGARAEARLLGPKASLARIIGAWTSSHGANAGSGGAWSVLRAFGGSELERLVFTLYALAGERLWAWAPFGEMGEGKRG